ncbi:MAG: YfhO family protein [Bacteroidota bacterium]
MKNNTFNYKKLYPHIVAIVLFLLVTYAYFYPQLKGMKLEAHDLQTFKGMSKEIVDYREQYGEEPLWTNSMFSGMPAYLISVVYHSNLFQEIIVPLNVLFGRPASFVFFSLIGFYIALLLFRVNPWLSIGGAFAFAFSSYFFIIIDAGHATKANALTCMPPIIAAIYYTYRRKILTGAVLTSLFLTIQIFWNHLQITYYTLMVVMVFVIIQFILDIKNKKIKNFLKASLALIFASIIAVCINFTSLYFVNDYGKDSIRGQSELTSNVENQTSGLDKDYATAWSYGVGETFTLLIPNFAGGESGGALDEKSASYEAFKDIAGASQARKIIKQLPLYWGPQPFTSGPVYIGAVVCFLFVLGLFVLKGNLKWWLLIATILSIALAWGKNMMWFTDIFLDYMPGYNKFRTVSMILVIAEFTMPLLGILAVQKILLGEVERDKLKKSLYWSLGIVGGLCLVFSLLPSAFMDFQGLNDTQYQEAGYPMSAIETDRESLLRSDAFRSLVFVLLAVVLLFLFAYKKMKKNYIYIGLALLFLIDMWPVNTRYLNKDNFVTEKASENSIKPTQADQFILQDKDPNYRVMNLAVSTFNDATTSYFHKSIGGYHGAKMRRYQELIEHQISKNNMAVLNMLNARYFIVPSEEQGPMPQQNPGALGNAWFVKNIKMVNNADEELKALDNFNPAVEAIVDKRFEKELENFSYVDDSNAVIKFVSYLPNHLAYETNSSVEQLAVFSEIFYAKGWNAYVDGAITPHFRADYVLRAMRIPAGNHKIEFKFEPEMFYTGNQISLASSILLILLILGTLWKEFFYKSKKEKSPLKEQNS